MKALVFRGPPHWSEKLISIERELIRVGIQVVRFTANAEAAFEHNLVQEFGSPSSFVWLPDVCDWDKEEELYRRMADRMQSLYEKPSAISLSLPVITDRILREIACDWVATRRLLDREKPDVCLALHELGRWGMILGYWSAVRRIPYFTFQEGMYYGDPWIYTNHCRYSTSLVWGEATKRKLVGAGCDPQRVIVMGHPDLRSKVEQARNDQEQVLAKLPPSMQGKRLILYFVTAIAVGSPNMDKIMEGIRESGQWGVVVHSHHMASRPNRQRLKELFAPWSDVAYYNEDFNALWPFMTASEVVMVTGCSTMGLELSYLRKPFVELALPNQHIYFSNLGLAVRGETMSILAAAQAALQEWQKPEQQERVTAFVSDEIANPDATADIVKYIQGDL